MRRRHHVVCTLVRRLLLLLLLSFALMQSHIMLLTHAQSMSIPFNFVAPPCAFNSSLLPLRIQASLAADCTSFGCGGIENWLNTTLTPADTYSIIRLPDYTKKNPSGSIGAQIYFQPSEPGTDFRREVMATYYVNDDPELPGVGNKWNTGDMGFPFASIDFLQSNVDSAPDGFNKVQTFLLLFTAIERASVGSTPYLLLNESCSFTFQFQVSCCSIVQPMQLAAQPYWILLLSTFTYFAASYVFVYTSIALDRFPMWRRITTTIKEFVSTTCCRFAYCHWGAKEEKEEEEDSGTADIQRVFPMSSMSQGSSQSLSDPLLDSAGPSAATGSVIDNHEFAELEAASGSAPLLAIPESISERLMQANGWFLVLQFLIAAANLFYLILKFTVLPKSTSDQSLNRFDLYERVYLFWTNSSVSTLLASSIASHIAMKYQRYQTLKLNNELPSPDEQNSCRGYCHCGCCCTCCRNGWARLKVFLNVEIPRDRLICRHIAVGILILLSPALLTHVLPMSLFFFPFVMIAFAMTALALLIVYGFIKLTERTAVRAFKKKLQSSSLHKQHYDEANEERKLNEDPIHPSVKQKTTVELPWYSLLLFRLVCTITVIIFVQTLYNYGTTIWKVTEGYYWEGVESDFSQFAKTYWFQTITNEYSSRSSQLYVQTIKRNVFEKIRAITLFL